MRFCHGLASRMLTRFPIKRTPGVFSQKMSNFKVDESARHIFSVPQVWAKVHDEYSQLGKVVASGRGSRLSGLLPSHLLRLLCLLFLSLA